MWDTKFLALGILKLDVKAFFADIEREDVRDAYIETIDRMAQEGFEGYTIFKFSLTFYWAEIEAFMDDFLKSWLTYARTPATLDVFDKIILPLSVKQFENLSRSEIMSLYVQGLKQKLRPGSEIKIFFAALDKVGLGACNGEEKKQLERIFTELQQIRNIMVHKGGTVDRRMMTACPWLQARPDIEAGKLYPLNIEVVQNFGKNILDLTDHVLDRLEKYASASGPEE